VERRNAVPVLVEWRELYVMLGGAAAALVGLLFVAVSLHVDTFVAPRAAPLRALALHTLLGYLLLLLLTICLLIPQQSARRLGLELALLGVVGLGWLPILVTRVVGDGAAWTSAWRAWLRTFLVWGSTMVGLLTVAAALTAGEATALDWLPLVAVALLLGAVLTSWDLLLRVPLLYGSARSGSKHDGAREQETGDLRAR
jgi:modulator of FtsH protease